MNDDDDEIKSAAAKLGQLGGLGRAKRRTKAELVAWATKASLAAAAKRRLAREQKAKE